MKQLDLTNTDNALEEIEKIMTTYYKGLFDTRQDKDEMLLLSAKLSTIYWFIAQEEANADTLIDKTKSQNYIDLKKLNSKMTIPELDSLVKLSIMDISTKKSKLTAALRSLDRWLTHISIRIKHLNKEATDTYNQ